MNGLLYIIVKICDSIAKIYIRLAMGSLILFYPYAYNGIMGFSKTLAMVFPQLFSAVRVLFVLRRGV